MICFDGCVLFLVQQNKIIKMRKEETEISQNIKKYVITKRMGCPVLQAQSVGIMWN